MGYVNIFERKEVEKNMVPQYLYLPECREILWFSDGSAAAAGYGGYGGGGYGEILT